MRYVLLAVVAAAVIAGAYAADQHADAGARKKIHFTQTFESSDDPGSDGHMALLLAPGHGTLYVGTLTYAASAPASPVVLHELAPGAGAGQPTWSADGITTYAASVLGARESGSTEFTGAALALRSDAPFTATASVDAWTRGQPAEVAVQPRPEPPEPEVRIARAAVPAVIPLSEGVNGGRILYVITGADGPGLASDVSRATGYNVTVSAALARAPAGSVQDLYVFTNGIRGAGLYGFQPDVPSASPGETGYSPLARMVEAAWKNGQKESLLGSAADVREAAERGRITLEERGIINAPHVSWPGGMMEVRAQSNSTRVPHEGGQLLGIDGGEATFVARRAWGPDGAAVHCVTFGVTPPLAAVVAGAAPSPALEDLDGIAIDAYRFANGIAGDGALGFQPDVLGPGDSPILRFHIVEWHDPGDALLLGGAGDIEEMRGEGRVLVYPARPLNEPHLANCPAVPTNG
ncbi:MAG: hypothetical protein MPI95_03885 [Nitrosopumilus sp.]|nr:hypothetical protein [Nitrosopumilus sp.]